MSISLTVTDLAGSPSVGATAAISGSSGGPVSVFTQQVTGQTGVGAWVNGGSRTGDGTVPLALAQGYYFAYAQEAAGISNLAYFTVTTGLEAVETRCKAAVKATIELLNLPVKKIVTQFEETAVDLNYPCIVLDTGEGVREIDLAAMNNRDDLGHPVRVLILDNKDALDQSAAKQALYESWRQKIYRAFVNQRLAGVPESIINKIESLALTEQEKGKFQTFRSGLVVRCHTREVRGLGA